MKLFLIASECPPVPGGIATYVGNTAAMFANAGHDITIFARNPQPGIERQGHCTWVKVAPKDTELLTETNAHSLSETHPSFPYNVMGYWAALSYQLAETVIDHIRQHGQPDIIESEDFSGLAYFLIQQKLTGCPELAGVPIVLTLHSSQYMLYPANQMPSYRLADYWVGRMEKFCTLAADGIIAPTQYIANQANLILGTHLGIKTIPLPATTSLIDHIPQAQPTPGDILYFGRLEVRKGILPLVAACSRLWDTGADFRLTAIGGDTWYHLQSCSMKTYLQRCYGTYIKAGQLVLASPIPHSQLHQRIAKAWCVVFPSLWENYPNTCIESMLLGKLILASSGVGHVEMLRTPAGEAGIVFDWAKPGDFEHQFQQVLDLSPESVLASGQRARELILKISNPASVLTRRLEHLQMVIEREHKHQRTVFPSLNYQPHGAISLPTSTPNSTDQKGKVSVCIPFYNHGEYIEETLDSVYAANYTDLEVILLNDGSIDALSIDKLASLQLHFPDLKLIHTSNQGVAAARNQMAEVASGEYLAFLDADDRVSPSFYHQAVKILNQYQNVGIVASWIKEFDRSQKVWIAWNPEFPYLLGHNMLGVCTVVRKSAYLAVGGMKSVLVENLEDYECWISLCEQGWAGVVIPELNYFYRIRPNSRLSSSNREQLLVLYERIARLHPDLYSKYSAELYHLMNQNGASWLWENPSQRVPGSSSDLTGMEIFRLMLQKLKRVHHDGGVALVFNRITRLLQAISNQRLKRFR